MAFNQQTLLPTIPIIWACNAPTLATFILDQKVIKKKTKVIFQKLAQLCQIDYLSQCWVEVSILLYQLGEGKYKISINISGR